MSTGHVGPIRRAVTLVACAGLAVMVGACGDDDDDDDADSAEPVATSGADTTAAGAVPTTAATETTAASATSAASATTGGGSAPPLPDTRTGEGTPVEVTLTEDGIEGLPTDLTAGLVDLSVTDETEAAGGDINFTRVAPGTDEAAFKEGLTPLFGGGPFPDFFLSTAGAIGSATLALDEGEYIVWIDLASNLERESTIDDIVTATMTVGPGDDDAQVAPTDGLITSTDYAFDIDVTAGGSTVTFVNDSTEQFHHVVVVDFGTNDPAVVEENMLALLESEDPSAVPEGIDGSQINFEFAGSGVFGPGGSGTFAAPFESGSTYAALCFIQDRTGGAPHAMQHQMFEVFQVD